MEILFFTLLASANVWSAPAPKTEIHLNAPGAWHRLPGSKDLAIYEGANHRAHELATVQVFARTSRDDLFFKNLAKNKNDLADVRGLVFEKVGLRDYRIDSITALKVDSSRFAAGHAIHARYLDAGGHRVESLEKQFIDRDHMYVVRYAIDSERDLEARVLSRRLDAFKAVANRDRAPAAEVADSASGTVLAPTASTPGPADLSGAIEVLTAKPIDAKTCEGVPADKLRTQVEPTFYTFIKNRALEAWGCGAGAVDSAKGLFSAVKFAAVDAPWAGVKYALGTKFERYRAFHDEVNATVGTLAAEIKKSPTDFATRVAAKLFTQAKKSVGDFFMCLNSAAQLRVICKMVADALTGKILLKLLMEEPLAAAEDVALSKAARQGLDAERKGAAPVAARPEIKAPATQTPAAVAEAPKTPAEAPAVKATVSARSAEVVGEDYKDLLTGLGKDRAEAISLIQKLERRGEKPEALKRKIRLELQQCAVH